MAWFDSALKHPIKHNFDVGGMIRPLRGLVLHIELGSEAGTRRWFNLTKAERQRENDIAWLKHGKRGSPSTPEERQLALTAAGAKRGGPRLPDQAIESSAHFGNPKKGRLEQFVDTFNKAYAQKGGNEEWISVENEGKAGDSLTPSQLRNVADLLGWLNWFEGVPLQLANNPSGKGLGYHGMFAGHKDCPGKPIIDQRFTIIHLARSWRPPGSSGSPARQS